jgi:hypothetical protein
MGGRQKKTVQEEMMKPGTTADRDTPNQPNNNKSDLDSRHGAVGIRAVAAALPYQSDAKNSAYARREAEIDDRFVNASA